MVDLHIHSLFSDGSETPERLVDLGVEAGLQALALTDHDTTAGTQRFAAAGRARGLQTISGVELSVEYPDGELHLLGYGFDPDHEELEVRLTELRGGRAARNLHMLRKLRDLGCPVTLDQLEGYAGNRENIGRPHFAMAMVDAGVVQDKQEAFDRFLAHGAPAYCDRLRLGPARAMRLLREARGLPVLAHPSLLRLRRKALRSLVASLKHQGLAGIEVYHSRHSFDETAALRWLAKDLGLLVTGGSDYHGQFNPQIRLGTGLGRLQVPNECYQVLTLR